MNFLYVAQCGLPTTAAGIRIYNIAKVLRQLGHNVVFLCGDFNNIDRCSYDSFTYLFNKSTGSVSSKIKHTIDSVFGCYTKKRIAKEMSINKYDAVIIYNDTMTLTKYVFKKIKVPVYADITEWYHFSLSNPLSDNLASLRCTHRMKTIDKNINGVICISNYLYSYYYNKNKNVIKVPPLFEPKRDNKAYIKEALTLIFCGTPANKECLNPLLLALREINTASIKIRFIVIGMTETEMKKKYCFLKKEDFMFIDPKGRIDRDKICSFYSEADFSVLLRKKKLNTMAGYSTKFAESLSFGVPVFCNDIGSCDLDIVDLYNGIKIKDLSEKTIYEGLLKMLTLSCESKEKMHDNSFIFASKMYSPQSYLESFADFFKKGDD